MPDYLPCGCGIPRGRELATRHTTNVLGTPACLLVLPPQATSIVEVPYLMAQSLIMVLIVYWMVGFQTTAWQVREGVCSKSSAGLAWQWLR